MTRFDPERSLGWIEIPQRITSRRTTVCYPFCRKHGKTPGNETAPLHHAFAAVAWPLAVRAQPSVVPMMSIITERRGRIFPITERNRRVVQ